MLLVLIWTSIIKHLELLGIVHLKKKIHNLIKIYSLTAIINYNT